MTPLPRRRALGTLVLVLALALAGCGGNDRKAQNDYVDTVNQIQAKFSSAYSRIAAQITSTTSKREDRATLDQLENEIDTTVTDLRAVKAPTEVAKLHTELVGVLENYGTQIGGLSDDLLAGNPARAARAMSSLASETSDASADFTRKVSEINSQLRD